MSQKIPIIYLLIGAIAIASVAFIVINKDVAIEKVFRGTVIVISNLDADLEEPAESPEGHSGGPATISPEADLGGEEIAIEEKEEIVEEIVEEVEEVIEEEIIEEEVVVEEVVEEEAVEEPVKNTPLPDYLINSFSLIPNEPIFGDVLSFSAIIKNSGNVHSDNSSFTGLEIDINNDGNWDIKNQYTITDFLSAGGKETELWKFVWAAEQGFHRYRICADADQRVKELDEDNNCVSKVFKVLPLESAFDSGGSPDLIVQSILHNPVSPIDGDMMSFYVTVKNQGQGSAVSNIYFKINDTIVGENSISDLIEDKAVTFIWKEIWKATSGSHTLRACIEDDCFESELTVLRTAILPDYIVDSTVLIPTNPVSGNNLSFSAVVKNQGNTLSNGISFTRLSIDGVKVGDASTDFLYLNGRETELWKFVWIAEQGTHRYQICADADGRVKESDETNNCKSAVFVIE